MKVPLIKTPLMKKPLKLNFFLAMLVAMATLASCSEVKRVLNQKAEQPESEVKNIILVIGDGMGPQQIGLLQTYAKQAKAPIIESRVTSFENLLNQGAELGLSMTYPAFNLVIDSAASASQLSTGELSGSEMIGLNEQGQTTPTLLEKAKAQGKAIGLVSDTRLTHATPAAFDAHQSHRSKESEIAEDMLSLEPEVMLSGGLRYWLPQEVNNKQSLEYKNTLALMTNSFKPKSKRKDSNNLLEQAKTKGYSLAFNRKQLDASQTKVLGLFSNSGMANGIEHSQTKNDPGRTEPSLLEMTEKALHMLSSNEEGFVLILEAGQIDWAAHDNDTGTTLHEMLKLNETMEFLLAWLEMRDDTLLVVTADHETGGFGFSYSANDLPEGVPLQGDAFRESLYKPNFNFGRPEVLEKLYAQKKSYTDIFYNEFDALPEEKQTAKALMNIVNNNTSFPITEKQAQRILQMEDNPFYVEGHKYLGKERVPEYHDNEAFFVYQNRLNLLAMEVSKDQNAVWSTGSHTSTPVLVFALGPSQNEFSGLIHHTELGEKLAGLLKK
jgi:alkaline phosphatase